MVTVLWHLLAVAVWTVLPLAIEAAAPVRYPCQGAGQHRRESMVRSFKRQHPCPAGPDKGSKKKCKGWEVDHIVPLACCGRDDPSNMQWLTREENRLKGAHVCAMSP